MPETRQASVTALGVAALRVAHQLLDSEPKILNDEILPKLLGDEMVERIRAGSDRFRADYAIALRTHLLVRQRYAEDRLAEAFRRGVRQYAIIGAGLDTFAYRQPAWAQDLHIFEIDHPESQRAKRQRLAAVEIAVPPNLTYVTLDLESDSLRDVLTASGFDPQQPAFAACLGVLMYLSEPANDKVFQFMGSLPASSELVLTFGAPKPDGEGTGRLAARVAELGEPFKTWLTAADLETKLRHAGFSDVSFLEPDEITERYLRGRNDGLHVPRRANTVAARV